MFVMKDFTQLPPLVVVFENEAFDTKSFCRQQTVDASEETNA